MHRGGGFSVTTLAAFAGVAVCEGPGTLVGTGPALGPRSRLAGGDSWRRPPTVTAPEELLRSRRPQGQETNDSHCVQRRNVYGATSWSSRSARLPTAQGAGSVA